MAYLAGTCTSTIDLLTTLKTFLTDNSWTLDGWKDSLTGARGETQAAGKELHIHKGDAYFSLKTLDNIRPFYGTTTMSGLGLIGATGYDDLKEDEDWAEQPGYPTDTDTSILTEAAGAIVKFSSGSYPYYMFLANDNNTLICCFEISSGYYKWFAFGTLSKFSSYTGGQFFAGCDHNWSSLSYLDNSFMRRLMGYSSGGWSYPGSRGFSASVYIDSGPSGTGWYCNGQRSTYDASSVIVQASNFHGVCSSAYYAWSIGRYEHSFASSIFIRGYNSITARRAMIPILVTVYNGTLTYPDPGNKYYPIGVVPGLRVVNMQNLSPGDEIVYGMDTWKIFPNCIQSGTNHISNVGLAVLKSS